MGIKVGIVALFAASIFLVYLLPEPTMSHNEEKILYAEPLLMRAVSNISHTLVSDILWLVSSGMGELSHEDVTQEESIAIAQSVTVMDPYFFPAIHYHATYLASIQGAPQSGAEVYMRAAWFAPEDFRLVFNEMILRLTYETPLDNERLIMLAKRAMTLPGKSEYLGDATFTEMVEGMMHYAANKHQQRARKREDLSWLLRHSSSLKRRAEVERQLMLIK